jgi:hypothetical protein
LDIKTGFLANHTNGGEGVSTTNPHTPIDTRTKDQKEKDRIKKASINIKKYNSTRVFSPETREKISKSRKGIPATDNTKKAASFHHSGDKCYFFGTLPWDTAKCKKINKDLVWSHADTIYDAYNAGHKTYTKLGKYLKIDRALLSGIVKKFDSGWNPYEDYQWLQWKSSYIIS